MPDSEERTRRAIDNAWSGAPGCAPGGGTDAVSCSNGGDLDVESELHHVAVPHHVILALDAGLAGGTRGGHRAGPDQLVVRDDLGLDEPSLEVRVNDSVSLRCGGAHRDRPGPRLLRTGRQVGLQAERPEADPDQ